MNSAERYVYNCERYKWAYITIGTIQLAISITLWVFAIWLYRQSFNIADVLNIEQSLELMRMEMELRNSQIVGVCICVINGFIFLATGLSSLQMPFGIKYILAKEIVKLRNEASNK